jgi:tetratricopeptide (TPR) repeat protein
VEQEAFGLVEGLFDRPLPRADVLELVGHHKGISDEVRRQALDLAERYRDEPARFRQASRAVVRHRGAGPDLFRKALAWAQTACRLAPDDGACWTALGLAQYRLGQYEEALKALARAEARDQANTGDRMTDLAFLAMAHQRLGHKAEAATVLIRLRVLAQRHAGRKDEDALLFLSEAETLLAP